MPKLTVFRNPGKTRPILTDRVLEIRYKHLEDGKLYRHPFKAGVSVELLSDGSARIFRKDGKPVLRNF